MQAANNKITKPKYKNNPEFSFSSLSQLLKNKYPDSIASTFARGVIENAFEIKKDIKIYKTENVQKTINASLKTGIFLFSASKREEKKNKISKPL